MNGFVKFVRFFTLPLPAVLLAACGVFMGTTEEPNGFSGETNVVIVDTADVVRLSSGTILSPADVLGSSSSESYSLVSSSSISSSSASILTPETGSSGIPIKNSMDVACEGFGSTLWRGDAGEYVVMTGVDAGSETSGFWYIYADADDGGASRITWPIAMGNDYSDEQLDPVIDYCGGVCGTYTLDQGTLEYAPFVGLGINVAGVDESGNLVSADVSFWGGICVAYSGDASMKISMGLGEELDRTIGYNYPSVSLPKSAEMRSGCFRWDDFTQEGAGPVTITGEDAATKLVSLRFIIQGMDGTTGKFNVNALGTYNALNQGL